jgi:phosphatidylethanolamine/phosphatidyl-N-methylethanolamine N-methyltransferase
MSLLSHLSFLIRLETCKTVLTNRRALSVKTFGMHQLVAGSIRRALVRRLANARQGSCAPWLFVREMLSQPANVGSIWPSSRRLAKNVASRVPCRGDGLVVELGGGTGAVTQALLQQGVAPGRLTVVESSSVFVRHLRARFPGVTILQGDAARLGELLPRDSCIDAIVSSLPLRSLPAREASAIVAQWGALVGEGGIVIQFTYALRDTGNLSLPGFLQRANDIVWANCPPARVLALEYHGGELN